MSMHKAHLILGWRKSGPEGALKKAFQRIRPLGWDFKIFTVITSLVVAQELSRIQVRNEVDQNFVVLPKY